MKHSKTLKIAGTFAAAVALSATVQASASAASWSSSQPTWGTASCSSAAKLTDGSHLIYSCMMYGGNTVQYYAMVLNGNSSDRYLPKAGTAVVGGTTCAAGGMPKQSTRWCLSAKKTISSGCYDYLSWTQYYWYEDKNLLSPKITRCG